MSKPKTIEKNCQNCSELFQANLSQLKLRNAKYCSLRCANLARGKNGYEFLNNQRKQIAEYNENPKLCEICSNPIKYRERHVQKFCSHSCSASRVGVRFKKVKVVRKKPLPRPKQLPTIPRVCVICNSSFLSHLEKTKTCGRACYAKSVSIRTRENPKCGGSTKQKINHNGIILDSSWELELAISLDANEILWERPTFFRLSDRRRYTPDFYLPKYGIYLDPKAFRAGYLTQVEKIKQFEHEYNVKCFVLGKNQLSWEAIKNLL
jgi:hypothetical protein